MFSILLCDLDLNHLVQGNLSKFQIQTIESLEDFENATFEHEYNLFIANIYYLDAIKELKELGNSTPVIFIDEYYDLHNLKKSFTVGDDYIFKPVNLQELQIRTEYHYKKICNITKEIIQYKNFYFHLLSKQLYKEKVKIKLSPSETKLLTLFLSFIQKPLTKELLFEKLETSSDGTLRGYISKLNKIGFHIEYQRSNQAYTLQNL